MSRQDLINALQNSDVIYTRDYLKTNSYLPFIGLKDFDPTYEFIDFIIINNRVVIGAYEALLKTKKKSR